MYGFSLGIWSALYFDIALKQPFYEFVLDYVNISEQGMRTNNLKRYLVSFTFLTVHALIEYFLVFYNMNNGKDGHQWEKAIKEKCSHVKDMVGAFNGNSLMASSLFTLFIGSYHGLMILSSSFKAHGRLVKGVLPFFMRVIIAGIMSIPIVLIVLYVPHDIDLAIKFLILNVLVYAAGLLLFWLCPLVFQKLGLEKDMYLNLDERETELAKISEGT